MSGRRGALLITDEAPNQDLGLRSPTGAGPSRPPSTQRMGFRGLDGEVAKQPMLKPRSHKLLTSEQIDRDGNWANIHGADGKIRLKSARRRQESTRDVLLVVRSQRRSGDSNRTCARQREMLRKVRRRRPRQEKERLHFGCFFLYV